MGRSALAMAVGTFLSRILGLVREQVFAFLFGASQAMDAFNIAFRIPNLLRDLFAEGALSSALVPTLVRAEKEGGQPLANHVVWQVIRALFWVTAALSVLGVFFAEPLVLLFAPKYAQQPVALALTTTLTQVLFPFFPLIAVAAVFMATLNTRGKFFVPAFASALFNATSIVVGAGLAFVFGKAGLEPILGMAVGVVIGGGVQAFCQLPLLRKTGFRTDATPVRLSDPHVRQILLLMVPGVLGLGATQINLLVNTILASSLETGAVSWLSYSFRLMQFPIGLFGVSIAAATLPAFSKAWTDGDRPGARDVLQRSLRQVLAINGPAAAGLAFLSGPIIALIYQYGAFHEVDTQATAAALLCYSLGLPFYSAVKVMVPICYAVGAVKVAVLSSVISVIVNIALNLALIEPLGHMGLALGTSVTAFLNSVFVFVLLKRRIGLSGWSAFGAILKYGALAILMGVAVFYLHLAIQPHLGRVALLVTVAAGAGVVLGVGRLIHDTEIGAMSDFILRRIRVKNSLP